MVLGAMALSEMLRPTIRRQRSCAVNRKLPGLFNNWNNLSDYI